MVCMYARIYVCMHVRLYVCISCMYSCSGDGIFMQATALRIVDKASRLSRRSRFSNLARKFVWAPGC